VTNKTVCVYVVLKDFGYGRFSAPIQVFHLRERASAFCDKHNDRLKDGEDPYEWYEVAYDY